MNQTLASSLRDGTKQSHTATENTAFMKASGFPDQGWYQKGRNH